MRQADATVGLGDGHVQQAVLPGLGDDLPGEVGRLVVVGRLGADHLAGELAAISCRARWESESWKSMGSPRVRGRLARTTPGVIAGPRGPGPFRMWSRAVGAASPFDTLGQGAVTRKA